MWGLINPKGWYRREAVSSPTVLYCSKYLGETTRLPSQRLLSSLSVILPKHLNKKKSGVRVPPDVVFPLFQPWVENGKSTGENHDKITLDRRVENGMNHLN